jgi:hypothetical protein
MVDNHESGVALRMGFESPVLRRLAVGVGPTGEAATIMQSAGSPHLISSQRQQLDLSGKDAAPRWTRASYLPPPTSKPASGTVHLKKMPRALYSNSNSSNSASLGSISSGSSISNSSGSSVSNSSGSAAGGGTNSELPPPLDDTGEGQAQEVEPDELDSATGEAVPSELTEEVSSPAPDFALASIGRALSFEPFCRPATGQPPPDYSRWQLRNRVPLRFPHGSSGSLKWRRPSSEPKDQLPIAGAASVEGLSPRTLDLGAASLRLPPPTPPPTVQPWRRFDLC